MRGDERDLPIPAPPQPLKLLGQNGPQISKQLCLLATGCPSLRGAGSPQGSEVQQGYNEHSSGVCGQARWRRSAFPPYHLLRDTGVSGTCWLLRAALHTSFLFCVVWGTPGPVPLSHTCPHLSSVSLAFLEPWPIKCWGQFLPLKLPLRLTNLPGGRTTGLGAGCFWSLGT